jgi:hypothetical protein
MPAYTDGMFETHLGTYNRSIESRRSCVSHDNSLLVHVMVRIIRSNVD